MASLIWATLPSLVSLVSAWTRLAVVESPSCDQAGCEVTARCPESTWPVACESTPRAGYAWLRDGSCVASALFDGSEIAVKLACTSMFRTLIVAGEVEARCPLGSSLQRCFCQDCYGQPATKNNQTCSAQVGRPQALCLVGDTQWLLQNAAGIGFVDYCGWVPYQRPQNLPAESYRNDTDCRYVLLNPIGFSGCSSQECTSLEECIARCDVCSNCSAVLQMASGTNPARCYLQEKIHVAKLRSEPYDTGFYVNERNEACEGEDEDRIVSRGISGVKVFADPACSIELKPQLYVMDAVGLTPFDSSPWLPRCASRRCDPGGLSFVLSFLNPTVVRCVQVQASEKYAFGWRLSKSSPGDEYTSIQSLTETAWQEVARSAKGMGVRATWDGLMEIEADLRSSLASWDDDVQGGNVAVLPVTISLLVFFVFLCLIIWFRYFHAHRNAAANLRLPVAVMLPPSQVEERLTIGVSRGLTLDILDEINFHEATESRMSYMLPQEVASLQNLLDFTYRSTVTPERPCPKDCRKPSPCPCVQIGGDPGLPVAFHALTALRLRCASSRYVKNRKDIQQKRDTLKCLEISSQLAVAKYPDLKQVLLDLEPSGNEAYLWYGTNIRKVFDLGQGLPQGSETAEDGLRFSESCTKADEHALDEAEGHYHQIFALLLCRVCLGRFYYSTDLDSTSRQEVKKGAFDSILLDRYGEGSREFVVYNPKQVLPEFVILYRRYYEGQDCQDPCNSMFKLEVPLHWISHRPLFDKLPFRSQLQVSKRMQKILQGLVEASSTSRPSISFARQIEDSKLWLRYLRARERSKGPPIKGAIEAPALDAESELLLWYLCGDAEEAICASEGSFQSSPRQRRAGIPLSETLALASCMGPVHVLLCRVALGDVHCTDSPPDLAFLQSARSAGKDALVAYASRGRKDFVLFQEEHIYPEFLLELKNTE